MRAAFLLLLCSCAAPPPEHAEDPAEIEELLKHPDVDRREEGLARLAIRGATLDRPVSSLLETDTDSISARMQESLAEPTPERMLWRAYHGLRAGCLAREGKRISSALREQGFRLIEIYEPKDGVKFTRFLGRASAYVNGAGNRHDLFLWIQTVRNPAGTWVVREVYVGLHVSFDLPFKTVMAIERYPRASVLGRFLELPELPKVAVVFPMLEEIEFTYGRIRDKESAAAGFHINAGFVMEGKAGGRSVYYSAESGLDPREAHGGKLERHGFVRTDDVGPLLPRGSGIWGAGGLKPAGED